MCFASSRFSFDLADMMSVVRLKASSEHLRGGEQLSSTADCRSDITMRPWLPEPRPPLCVSAAAPICGSVVERYAKVSDVRVVSYNIDYQESMFQTEGGQRRHLKPLINELVHLLKNASADVVCICEFGSHVHGFTKVINYDGIIWQIQEAVKKYETVLHVHNSYLLLVRSELRKVVKRNSVLVPCRANLTVGSTCEVHLHPDDPNNCWRKCLVFSILVHERVGEGLKCWEIVGTVLHNSSGKHPPSNQTKQNSIERSIKQMSLVQKFPRDSVDCVHLILGDFNTNSRSTKLILAHIQPQNMLPARDIWHFYEQRRDHNPEFVEYPDVVLSRWGTVHRVEPIGVFAVGRDFQVPVSRLGYQCCISAAHNAIFLDVRPSSGTSVISAPPSRPPLVFLNESWCQPIRGPLQQSLTPALTVQQGILRFKQLIPALGDVTDQARQIVQQCAAETLELLDGADADPATQDVEAPTVGADPEELCCRAQPGGSNFTAETQECYSEAFEEQPQTGGARQISVGGCSQSSPRSTENLMDTCDTVLQACMRDRCREEFRPLDEGFSEAFEEQPLASSSAVELDTGGARQPPAFGSFQRGIRPFREITLASEMLSLTYAAQGREAERKALQFERHEQLKALAAYYITSRVSVVDGQQPREIINSPEECQERTEYLLMIRRAYLHKECLPTDHIMTMADLKKMLDRLKAEYEGSPEQVDKAMQEQTAFPKFTRRQLYQRRRSRFSSHLHWTFGHTAVAKIIIATGEICKDLLDLTLKEEFAEPRLLELNRPRICKSSTDRALQQAAFDARKLLRLGRKLAQSCVVPKSAKNRGIVKDYKEGKLAQDVDQKTAAWGHGPLHSSQAPFSSEIDCTSWFQGITAKVVHNYSAQRALGIQDSTGQLKGPGNITSGAIKGAPQPLALNQACFGSSYVDVTTGDHHTGWPEGSAAVLQPELPSEGPRIVSSTWTHLANGARINGPPGLDQPAISTGDHRMGRRGLVSTSHQTGWAGGSASVLQLELPRALENHPKELTSTITDNYDICD